MKEKIRPIYQALIGYMAQAPVAEKIPQIYDSALWEQIALYIKDLNDLTGNDYSRFEMKVMPAEPGWSAHVSTLEYRSKLNGFVMRLHAEFFNDEATPFSGTPGLVVSQNQQQSQVTQISMLMDFQSMVDKELYGSSLKQEEKTFLEKVKSSLPTIKSVTELVVTLIRLAKDCGLDINQLKQLFKI